MSVRKTQNNKNTYYFITLTCFEWIHLFEITNLYDHIYAWFDQLKLQKILINGFVIMPNHLHLITYVSEILSSINKVIGNAKRFMAYEIVKRLNEIGRFDILRMLNEGVNPNERKKGKLHNVFEPSFDAKEILTEKFVVQKLNYIHQNPVRGKWHLVDDYRLYKHSSAGFYEFGSKDGYKVIHYERAIEYFLQSPC